MDSRTFRRHRKISKNHTRHCPKCGYPKREEACYHNGCPVLHCACAMTDPDIDD